VLQNATKAANLVFILVKFQPKRNSHDLSSDQYGQSDNGITRASENAINRDDFANFAPGTQEWASMLSSFLDSFQAVCAFRNSLYGNEWLDVFYSLCLMSIVQSLLVDIAIESSSYGGLETWPIADSHKIPSLYKALVSVFCWSSCHRELDSSTEVQSPKSFSVSFSDRPMIAIPEKVVQHTKWRARGIKSLRQFLFGLGSEVLPDGLFNGFLVQRSFSIKNIGGEKMCQPFPQPSAQNTFEHNPSWKPQGLGFNGWSASSRELQHFVKDRYDPGRAHVEVEKTCQEQGIQPDVMLVDGFSPSTFSSKYPSIADKLIRVLKLPVLSHPIPHAWQGLILMTKRSRCETFQQLLLRTKTWIRLQPAAKAN
jgi:hypothetical protein